MGIPGHEQEDYIEHPIRKPGKSIKKSPMAAKKTTSKTAAKAAAAKAKASKMAASKHLQERAEAATQAELNFPKAEDFIGKPLSSNGNGKSVAGQVVSNSSAGTATVKQEKSSNSPRGTATATAADVDLNSPFEFADPKFAALWAIKPAEGFSPGVDSINFNVDVMVDLDDESSWGTGDFKMKTVKIDREGGIHYFKGMEMLQITIQNQKKMVAYVGPSLVLVLIANQRVYLKETFPCPRGELSLYEVLWCVEQFEYKKNSIRADPDHCFFEGFLRQKDGSYIINFGS